MAGGALAALQKSSARGESGIWASVIVRPPLPQRQGWRQVRRQHKASGGVQCCLPHARACWPWLG